MASIVNYVADGSTNQFQIPFTYINQADVVVTVNGATPTFTFLNSTTINIAATPASGAKVIIKRVTPLNALVDFTDGSTLFEADLDLAHQQNRLISEESRDRADSAIATIDANITNIDTVAGIASNVTTVAGNTANVNSVANNMAEVLTADDNAATATTKAAEASASASTATAQATISTTKASESSASAAASLASKNAAATSESNAATSETNAANSATASANSASASSSSATGANGSATTATTKASEALTSANNAATSETNAANSATTATTKASEASASQSAAATSEANALSSKNAAATSETNAATSETNAATSETNAAASATTATTKASEASTSETNAAASQVSATASAAIATTQAGIATTKASEAAASATSIGNAETTTTANAVAAANSAAAAAAALDNFDDKYLGVKSSDPTVDNDGDALVQGALYFSSSSSSMQVYDGANWIAASSSGIASLTLFEYTATAGQTAFSGSDDNGLSMSFIAANLIVTMNGVILDPSDYTTTSGLTVTLDVGAAVGDVVNIYAFKSFQVADTVPATTGGTFIGPVQFNSNVTVSGTVDGRDLAADGTKLDGIATSANNYTHPSAHPISFITGLQTALDNINTDLVNDTSPQLGGNLDVNSNDITSSGDLTLDVAGDITLDADGGDIRLKDSGTQFGVLYKNSNDFSIYSAISDGDMKFQGLDGSSVITALTLDMSDAGYAYFNSYAKFTDNQRVVLGTSDDLQIYHDAGGYNQIVAQNDHPIQIKTASENMIKAIPNGGVELYHNNSKKLETTSSGVSVTGDIANASGSMTIDVGASLRLDSGAGEIELREAGTVFGNFAKTGNDFRINQSIQDGDLVFRGNDGGSIITALTLDMSNAGAATFNNAVTATTFHGDGSNLTGVSPPTALGAVGTYAYLKNDSGTTRTAGYLGSTSTGYQWGSGDATAQSGFSGTAGTWRCMGYAYVFKGTVWCRVS